MRRPHPAECRRSNRVPDPNAAARQGNPDAKALPKTVRFSVGCEGRRWERGRPRPVPCRAGSTPSVVRSPECRQNMPQRHRRAFDASRAAAPAPAPTKGRKDGNAMPICPLRKIKKSVFQAFFLGGHCALPCRTPSIVSEMRFLFASTSRTLTRTRSPTRRTSEGCLINFL